MKKDGVMKSRRKFIKKLGGAALGAAAASAVPTIAGAVQGATTQWAATYDWVCVGSGLAGCAPAIFGHDKGFKTLLIEKSDMIGGQTSQSAGILWVPNNPLMKEAGIPDSREAGLAYLRYVGAGQSSPEYMEAFVDNAPRAVDYLRKNAEVKFRICELIDFFHQFSDGGWRLNEDVDAGSKRYGHALLYEPFPAETLGKWRDKVRLSDNYHGLGVVLEGQEHNPSLGRLTKGASLGPAIGHAGPRRGVESVALRLWRKRLGSEKLNELLKMDEEQRVAGAALVAYVFRAIIRRGIEVRTETSAERLLTENGRVVGVVVKHGGREENIRVTKGVVLATGSGSGWKLASGIGAEVRSIASVPSLQSPDLRDPLVGPRDPKDPYGPLVGHGNYETRMRHSISVNRFGERFANELSYGGMSTKLQFDSHGGVCGERGFVNIPSYFIFDHQLIEKYSFAGRPPGETEGLDWVAQGKTLAELAQKLKIDARKLEATVTRFNEIVRRKEDPDFHRRPETLGTIEKPPFYGVQAGGAESPLIASITVVTNPRGQVLHDQTKNPIPGLYAIGGVTGISDNPTVWGPGYQAGFGHAAQATFGLLAAEHAASV